MRRILCAWALAIVGSGCAVDSNHAEVVCDAICDCQTGLPVEHSRCVAGCVDDVPDVLPAACFECLVTDSCVQLLAGSCASVCDVSSPPNARGPEPAASIQAPSSSIEEKP